MEAMVLLEILFHLKLNGHQEPVAGKFSFPLDLSLLPSILSFMLRQLETRLELAEQGRQRSSSFTEPLHTGKTLLRTIRNWFFQCSPSAGSAATSTGWKSQTRQSSFECLQLETDPIVID